MMENLWKEMELFVKNRHVEADVPFKGNPEQLFQGGQQGNGLYPGFWISISVIVT